MRESKSFYYYPDHFRINQLTELDKGRIHKALNYSVEGPRYPSDKKSYFRFKFPAILRKVIRRANE